MEINRATTLAKVLYRERALQAQDRRDETIRNRGLSDEQVFPGSTKFQEAVEVTKQYLADLTDARISSVQDAHAQTGIPMTGKTVEDVLSGLRSGLDELIAARLGTWQHSAQLLEIRNAGPVFQSQAAITAATLELNSYVAKLYQKAEARLDVLLQSSLASREKSPETDGTSEPTMNAPRATAHRAEKIAAFVFGVVFVLLMLYINLYVPNPTETQWFTFRVVLALAAAGVGALLPGLLWVTVPNYVRAGGALALFIVVYWFNPPRLVTAPPQEKKNTQDAPLQQHPSQAPFDMATHAVQANPTKSPPGDTKEKGMNNKGTVEANSDHPTISNAATSQAPGSLPLSLEFQISQRKVLTVHNFGREVKDIRLRLTKYTFDADAFNHHAIKIANYSQFGGATLLNIVSLPPKKTSKPLDLFNITFLGFKQFPTDATQLPLDYYGMRFTFRDVETTKKYAYYKVTSVIRADPLLPDEPDTATRSGPGDKALLFTDEIPIVIKDHQRMLYRNREEEEYKP